MFKQVSKLKKGQIVLYARISEIDTEEDLVDYVKKGFYCVILKNSVPIDDGMFCECNKVHPVVAADCFVVAGNKVEEQLSWATCEIRIIS